MEECHKMFTDQIDWTNPEGDQVSVDVNQPLPLGGPLEHPSDTYAFTMKVEILLKPTSNKLMVVTNRFTLIVLSALRRSDKENRQVRSVLTDPEVQVKMEMEIPHSSGDLFLTACSYSTYTSKDLIKAQVYVSKLPQL
ncbi:hypothetical protein Tco_1056806 [Tanacetum coccineum]|uniref:Uncharacterized protein n=1 Tax=Tanacetum coccineum TaxID=301880 RepID=A0ABQ5H3T5_9ASTR